ncbi:MAG: hypothetical protein WCQ99_17845 [Pseudomonadota bacterium]
MTMLSIHLYDIVNQPAHAQSYEDEEEAEETEERRGLFVLDTSKVDLDLSYEKKDNTLTGYRQVERGGSSADNRTTTKKRGYKRGEKTEKTKDKSTTCEERITFDTTGYSLSPDFLQYQSRVGIGLRQQDEQGQVNQRNAK